MIQSRLAKPPVPHFTPVPRRAMSGGWTVARQRSFIAALAATGSVAQAAAAVKMSKTGVYLLRAAPGAESFRVAWDRAIEDGVAVLKSVAFERAIDGVEITHRKDGEITHTTTQFDSRLLTRLLAIYDSPQREAARAARAAQAAMQPQREEVVAKFKALVRRFAAEDAQAQEQADAVVEAEMAEAEFAMAAGRTCDASAPRAAPDGFGIPLSESPQSPEWRPPMRSGPRVWSP